MPPPSSTVAPQSTLIGSPQEVKSWSTRYGDRHKLERIMDFPRGIAPPDKIRLYWRRDHYVLQWWDPPERRTLSDRVDGDLVAALMRAREIERRLSEVGRSGMGRRRLGFLELIECYLDDAAKRAACGEIDLRTVVRYRSALEYLRQFADQPGVGRSYPYATSIDRPFLLQFGSFLKEQVIAPNGHANATPRPMRGQHYVLQIVRAVFCWATDPERGNLLPADFRSPFQSKQGTFRRPSLDLTREPPITVDMTVQFIHVCDEFKLRLFLPLILFGLRASEPMWLFHEDVDRGWLNVCCHPDLDYLTKGQRDKRFPLVDDLSDLWEAWSPLGAQGPVLLRRAWTDESKSSAVDRSYDALVATYRALCQDKHALTVVARRQIRDRLIREAGALNYDQIDGEFRRVARTLGWKATATLKGFRHLFATALENSGCPETYRRFFLGHSPGRAASIHYTHLDQLQRHFQNFLVQEYADVVSALRSCAAELFRSPISEADTTAVTKRHKRTACSPPPSSIQKVP